MSTTAEKPTFSKVQCDISAVKNPNIIQSQNINTENPQIW